MLTKSRLENWSRKLHSVEFSGGWFYKYSHHLHRTENICEWIGLVMPGLAVLEHVGARGHFGKCTPEFLEDQV